MIDSEDLWKLVQKHISEEETQIQEVIELNERDKTVKETDDEEIPEETETNLNDKIRKENKKTTAEKD